MEGWNHGSILRQVQGIERDEGSPESDDEKRAPCNEREMPRLRNRALPNPQAITPSSRQIAITMAQAAFSEKAEAVVILDLRKLSFSFDFFVLCSAASGRRVRTVAEKIEAQLSDRGVRSFHAEGQPDGGWTLLDYGPVVAHIFEPNVRQFYGLERLWADAPRLSIPQRKR